jgi:hypothetical protein
MKQQQRVLRFASGALRTLVLFTLLLALPVRADDKADLNQEVTLRCIYDVGEFGDDAVQACRLADLAAAEALTKYPPEAQAIVDRCMKSMWTRGYGMVQLCVDQDIAAAAALGRYSAQHSAAIRACEQKVGKRGPAKVKACVDAAIAPQEAGQQ